MPFSVDGLTVGDFDESGWREVVEGARGGDCLHYRAAFYAKADESRAAGNDKGANLFSLLGDLASMFIDADDPADPLKPMWQMGDKRSAIPSDFDPALAFLADILPRVDDPELAARVADVVWLCKRDFKAARAAVVAYLDAARIGEREHWSEATDRIERAVHIATWANQRDLLDEATRRLEDALASFSGTEASFLPVRLMQLLQGRRAGDPAKYAALSEALAAAAEGRGDWNQAREYWNAQADWFKIAQDQENEKVARLRGAETYVQEAESRLDTSHGEGYMVAAHFLERAIHALRAIGGQRERIADLHRRLLEYQRQAVSEMRVVSHEVDASQMIVAATEAVAGKSLYDALFALALLGSPPKLATLRRQAQWQRENAILSIIPMRFLNALGRTVARRDPPDAGETEDEAALRIEMYRTASLSHALHVQGLIAPALSQILREHTVREHDLRQVVRDNPLVPQGREEFYVRGLHAGFRGDWATAVHLLVPQIENSVRHVLEDRGVITSGLDDDGIQDERDLNRTLRLPEFTHPLKEVFGEDLVFDLRGLLIERYGANLRNDMAHGLLDYDAFHSAPCVYLWWLTLRLLCLPAIAGMHGDQQQEAADKGVEGADAGEAEAEGDV